MTRVIAAVAALGLSLSACTQVGGDAPPPTTAPEITGVWKGNLTENSGSTFSVTVTIASPLVVGQQGAEASYRGIGGPGGCSGTWVYNGQEQGSFTFTETITSGAEGSCDGTGDVTLTPAPDDILQYVWKDGSDNSIGMLARP